jgi:hypothetical protein
MKGPKASAEIGSRLILFPFVVQSRFIDLIKDQAASDASRACALLTLLASFGSI